MKTLHQLENAIRVSLVEVSGRFVGQKKGGIIHERPGDGNSLLLATGELSGGLFCPARQSYFIEPVLGGFQSAAQSLAANQQRHRNIFRSSEVRQQVMPLPDKANGMIAIICQFRLS